MADNLCALCGRWSLFPATHQCQSEPQWLVWRADETIDEAKKIRAYRADAAVEEWAQKEDADGDYEILDCSPVTVNVQQVVDEGEPEAPIEEFSVSGESTPVYRAWKTTEDRCLEVRKSHG